LQVEGVRDTSGCDIEFDEFFDAFIVREVTPDTALVMMGAACDLSFIIALFIECDNFCFM